LAKVIFNFVYSNPFSRQEGVKHIEKKSTKMYSIIEGR